MVNEEKIESLTMEMLEMYNDGEYSYANFKEENPNEQIPESYRNRKRAIKDFLIQIISQTTKTKTNQKYLDILFFCALSSHTAADDHAEERKRLKNVIKKLKKEKEILQDSLVYKKNEMEKDLDKQIRKESLEEDMGKELLRSRARENKRTKDLQNLYEKNQREKDRYTQLEKKYRDDVLGLEIELKEAQKASKNNNKARKETKKEKEKRIRAEAKIKMEASIKSQLDSDNDDESDDLYVTSDDELHE